jgi:predicted nicotinamide N-methyase
MTAAGHADRDDRDHPSIDGHRVRLVDVAAGARTVRLCCVDELETLVDRDAVLRGDVEPPYWAYLWSGARVLADYVARWVDVRKRRVLEIGCGLGLPALTAATAGAEVTAVDAEAGALAFVRASAAANGTAVATLAVDFTAHAVAPPFDLVLAAEVAYERARFTDLAAVFARQLACDGIGLLADGYRTDTRGVYRALTAAGLTAHAIDVIVDEEGRRMPVRLTLLRHARSAAVTRRDSRRRPA